MWEILHQLSYWALLDIALIAFVVYHLLILIRGTRAAQVLTGILVLAVSFFLLSQVYPLTTFKWMMNKFYSSFIIILVIIFQEDIRVMLSRVGKKPLLPGGEAFSSKQIIDEIIRAAFGLSQTNTGALIVIERNILLSKYIDVGVQIDAKVTKEILMCIFHSSSPIHDGACVIQQGRLAAAACFLPLTRDENIDPNLGTRNRAALGVSQETDALVVLVSEEEGTVNLVKDGSAFRDLDPKELRRMLWSELNPDKQPGQAQEGLSGGLNGLRSFAEFWGARKK